MKHELKRAAQVFKTQGLKPLVVKSFNYFIRSFYLPKCLLDIKKLRSSSDISLLVNSVLTKWRGLIKPLQVKSEITNLLQFLKDKKLTNIMEIGTANGGTLFLFCRITNSNGTIISVDLPCGLFGGGYPRWKKPLYQAFADKKQTLHLLREDSHKKSTLKKVETILAGKKLDFLFIDGDHSYKGVKKDFELYKHLVRKGGYIGLHDIVKHEAKEQCDVDKFWHEISKKHQTKEIVENHNQKWGGIGIISI